MITFTFKHYGIEVICQRIAQSFEKSLKDEHIEYIALPYLQDIVFRYMYNGHKKICLCSPNNIG